MAFVSDKPWGDFTPADYSPEQWRRACLVHLQPAKGQDPADKSLHKLPVREPEGALNRNAIHAAAGAHGISAVQGITDEQRRIAAQELVRLYETDLKEEPPASLESLAGVDEAADQEEDAREPVGRSRAWYDRSFPLEGIEILSRAKGGDGRTVEAYAAVFDQPQEIHDQHGDYFERIDRTAFNRTLNNGGASRALPLYHHGMNVVDAKPNPLAQVPIGKAVDIRADGRGLLTVTRFNKSPLAESVLEAIKNDDITGYSFRGGIYRSDPMRIPRTRPGQPLPNVRRTELGLSDYGPTPTPYYQGAAIVAVRSVHQIASDLAGLDEAERQELIRMLATTRYDDPEPTTATPHRGLGTEDSRLAHSGRMKSLRLRAEAAFAGVSSGTQAERDHF